MSYRGEGATGQRKTSTHLRHLVEQLAAAIPSEVVEAIVDQFAYEQPLEYSP